MGYKTYACGTIDISGLSKVSKMEIKNYLEELYGTKNIHKIYDDESITIEDEWENVDHVEKLLVTLSKICIQLEKATEAEIICNGDREGDIWAILIKNKKVFTQKFELKPSGSLQEYEKVRYK